MSRAGLDLRARVLARLSGTSALVDLLGGRERILDRLPRGGLPFLLIGPAESRDFSTATEPGEEHLLTLEIWTDADRPGQAGALAAELREALSTPLPPAAPGGDDIRPDFLWSRARRVAAARALVTAVAFRAVTEG